MHLCPVNIDIKKNFLKNSRLAYFFDLLHPMVYQVIAGMQYILKSRSTITILFFISPLPRTNSVSKSGSHKLCMKGMFRNFQTYLY